MDAFRVDVKAGDVTDVLILSGEADLVAAPVIIEQGIERLDKATTTELVVDLEGVTFMDSTALGALVKLHNTAEQGGKQLTLSRVPKRITQLLTITGLDTLLAVRPAP